MFFIAKQEMNSVNLKQQVKDVKQYVKSLLDKPASKTDNHTLTLKTKIKLDKEKTNGSVAFEFSGKQSNYLIEGDNIIYCIEFPIEKIYQQIYKNTFCDSFNHFLQIIFSTFFIKYSKCKINHIVISLNIPSFVDHVVFFDTGKSHFKEEALLCNIKPVSYLGIQKNINKELTKLGMYLVFSELIESQNNVINKLEKSFGLGLVGKHSINILSHKAILGLNGRVFGIDNFMKNFKWKGQFSSRFVINDKHTLLFDYYGSDNENPQDSTFIDKKETLFGVIFDINQFIKNSYLHELMSVFFNSLNFSFLFGLKGLENINFVIHIDVMDFVKVSFCYDYEKKWQIKITIENIKEIASTSSMEKDKIVKILDSVKPLENFLERMNNQPVVNS